MKCPKCNNNTISPIKKFINKNIKCSSCGKNIKFSESKRGLVFIVFVIANYFNMIINPKNSMLSYLIFFSLLIVVFGLFMIIPIDRDK